MTASEVAACNESAGEDETTRGRMSYEHNEYVQCQPWRDSLQNPLSTLSEETPRP